jgi:hypothetical protein
MSRADGWPADRARPGRTTTRLRAFVPDQKVDSYPRGRRLVGFGRSTRLALVVVTGSGAFGPHPLSRQWGEVIPLFVVTLSRISPLANVVCTVATSVELYGNVLRSSRSRRPRQLGRGTNIRPGPSSRSGRESLIVKEALNTCCPGLVGTVAQSDCLPRGGPRMRPGCVVQAATVRGLHSAGRCRESTHPRRAAAGCSWPRRRRPRRRG